MWSLHDGNIPNDWEISFRETAKVPAGWKQGSAVIREILVSKTRYYNRKWPFVDPLGINPAAQLHNMRKGNYADNLLFCVPSRRINYTEAQAFANTGIVKRWMQRQKIECVYVHIHFTEELNDRKLNICSRCGFSTSVNEYDWKPSSWRMSPWPWGMNKAVDTRNNGMQIQSDTIKPVTQAKQDKQRTKQDQLMKTSWAEVWSTPWQKKGFTN